MRATTVGNDHNAVPGALASTPFVEAAIHL